jgi:hypothetical protein
MYRSPWVSTPVLTDPETIEARQADIEREIQPRGLGVHVGRAPEDPEGSGIGHVFVFVIGVVVDTPEDPAPVQEHFELPSHHLTVVPGPAGLEVGQEPDHEQGVRGTLPQGIVAAVG